MVEGLVVVPAPKRILPLDVDFGVHLFTDTNPDPTLPAPMLFSGRHWRRLRQMVPWMPTPAVPMPLPSSGAGLHLQWGWSGVL